MRPLLILLVFAHAALAQSVGDFSIPYRENPTGPQTLKSWAKVNDSLWGTDPSGNPISITTVPLTQGGLGMDLTNQTGFPIFDGNGGVTIAATISSDSLAPVIDAINIGFEGLNPNISVNNAGQVTAITAVPFTDITTGNASTSKHGYLPKLGGGTTNFLRADGTWAAPTNQTISFAPTGDVTGSASGTTSLAPALSIGAGKVTNTMLAGSIDLTTKVTGLLPDSRIASASAWNGKWTAQATAVSADASLLAGHSYLASDGTYTLTLPASPAVGDSVRLMQIGSWSGALTLARNGSLLDGTAADQTIYSPGPAHGDGNVVTWTFVGSTTGWRSDRYRVIPSALYTDLGTLSSSNTSKLWGSAAIATGGYAVGTEYTFGNGLNVIGTTINAAVTLGANTFTGVQTLSAGSVSAPALTFGDSTTGWYRSGSNEIAAAISGVQAVKIAAAKTVISGNDGGGNVLNLVSSNGTTTFTIGGGGALYFNGGANVNTAGFMTGAQPGNSANYAGIGYDSTSGLPSFTGSSSTFTFGLASGTPAAKTLSGTQAEGSNITGGDLNLGTRGTGTGTSGSVNLQAHAAGSSGSALGTLVTILSVNGSGAVLNAPLKLPSYIVSGLPSAADMGAGSMAFVTDATLTTAYTTVIGGGSNKVLVISDGSNWIIH